MSQNVVLSSVLSAPNGFCIYTHLTSQVNNVFYCLSPVYLSVHLYVLSTLLFTLNSKVLLSAPALFIYVCLFLPNKY